MDYLSINNNHVHSFVKKGKENLTPLKRKKKWNPFAKPSPIQHGNNIPFNNIVVKNLAQKVFKKRTQIRDINNEKEVNKFLDSILKSFFSEKITKKGEYGNDMNINKTKYKSDIFNLHTQKNNTNNRIESENKSDLSEENKEDSNDMTNQLNNEPINLKLNFKYLSNSSKNQILSPRLELNIDTNYHEYLLTKSKSFHISKNKCNLYSNFSNYSDSNFKEFNDFTTPNLKKIKKNRRSSIDYLYNKILLNQNLEKNSRDKFNFTIKRDFSLSTKRYTLIRPESFLSHFYVINQSGRRDNKIKINQDKYLYLESVFGIDEFDIFGVMDGHGEYGHLVTQYIKNSLETFFQNSNIFFDYSNLINLRKNKRKKIEGMEKGKAIINQKEIYKIMSKDNYNILSTFFNSLDRDIKNQIFDSYSSGCTCVINYRIYNKIICSNIGDSRSILISYDKNTNKYFYTLLSIDHKPSNPEEKKRIYKKGGEIKIDECGLERFYLRGEDYPGMSVSRALGDHDSKHGGLISTPEFIEINYNNNMCFIVTASDGVWEYISNEEVMNIVKNFYCQNDVKGAVNAIIKIANERWREKGKYRDDITCLVYFFK